jgi:hypothetical protein
VRDAREAQQKLEEIRLAHLPPAQDDARQPCDVTIGRLCYWYTGQRDEIPLDPPEVDGARAGLLESLADAAQLLPGDRWIAGQRVRYLVEHGRPAAAVTAARECGAERWWCIALEAFALHASEDDAAADTLFANALALMPADERCRWNDLSLVLGEDAGSYAKLPCEAREARNARIWWLGQPLYLRPGNDLRVEHYARRVMARMLERAATPQAVSWGPDREELILRYGWPVYWTQGYRRHVDDIPSAVGHQRSPSWWFFASRDVPPRWDVDRERPSARYAPTWAAAFSTIREAQIARFRRGDSVVTVAGFDLSGDTTLAGATPQVALAVGTDATTPIVIGGSIAATHGAVAVASADPPALVSLEALREEARWAARLRGAVADPTAWMTSPLSDILLVRAEAATSGVPGPLTTVALPSPVLPGRQPVGVYWEWYQRPAPGTIVTIEAKVARIGGKGLPDPLGHSECAPADKAALAVQWRETVGNSAAGVGRVVALDLARLERGRYIVAVATTVEGDPGPVHCTSREIALTGL